MPALYKGASSPKTSASAKTPPARKPHPNVSTVGSGSGKDGLGPDPRAEQYPDETCKAKDVFSIGSVIFVRRSVRKRRRTNFDGSRGSTTRPSALKSLGRKFRKHLFFAIVEATNNLPEADRDWKCAFCDAARQLAESHRRRTVHPRISIKKWKNIIVSRATKGKPKGAKLKAAASRRGKESRKAKYETHKVVAVPVASARAAEFRRANEYWCVHCLTKVGGYGGGSKVRIKGRTDAQSKALPKPRQRIRAARKRLENRFITAGEPVLQQVSQWVRDLVKDGDVESHPGRDAASLRCASVNVGESMERFA